MDAVMDILRRNHQAWPYSNDGRPSMMTESAPVLPSLHPALTHFLLWYTVSKCASSPSRLLSCTRATYRATSSRTLKWERSPDCLGVGPALLVLPFIHSATRYLVIKGSDDRSGVYILKY